MKKNKTLVSPAGSKSAGFYSGLAVTGVMVTAIMSSRAAIKAHQRLADLEKESSPADVQMHETWNIYIPASIAASATVLCVLKASRCSRLRSEALLTAFIFEPYITAAGDNVI